MVEAFAPQFFILIGIDIFLGGGIITILFDQHFPSPFPYILEVTAFIGFAELAIGPSYLAGLSTTLQFYYSFTYSMIAAMGLLAANLYLLFVKNRPFESGLVATTATVPSFLANLFFASAYVNGLALELPVFPIVPISIVYVLFFASGGLLLSLVIGLVLQARQGRGPA